MFCKEEEFIQVYNMVHDFWKKFYKEHVFSGSHEHQKSQKGAQKILLQNFQFFQSCN